MHTLSTSHRLLPFANRMRQTLTWRHDRATQVERHNRPEFRALSRWENEGGAIHYDDPGVLDAGRASR